MWGRGEGKGEIMKLNEFCGKKDSSQNIVIRISTNDFIIIIRVNYKF